MYSRDFGGIQSEGQLYNYEREYNQGKNRESFSEPTPTTTEEASTPAATTAGAFKKGNNGGISFLRNLKLDDLLLIGIGLLLLLDSDEENDIFSLLIAILLIL